jgi:hypothetical protein
VCWKTSLRRFIAGNMCCVKTSSLYRVALRLPGMCTGWVFWAEDMAPHTIILPPPKTYIGTDSQKPSPWKPLTHQTSLLWRSIETSASTCKDPMVQQSKGQSPAKLEASPVQRCTSGFHGDGFWLSVPIYVGHQGQLMLFLLLSRFGFSDEVPRCSDIELLMCPCCATG